MNPTVERLQRKQNYETLAAEAGEERAKLEDKLTVNTQWIIDLMPKAQEAGIPFDTFAKLVGVSRQTLYRWREVALRIGAKG
jgi:hypothetical protein